MNCLYIVKDDPVSQNFIGGGASIYYDQLRCLSLAGFNIILLHYTSESKRKTCDEFYANNKEDLTFVNSVCSAIINLNYSENMSLFGLIQSKLSDITNKSGTAYYSIYNGIARQIKQIVREEKIDFIWAQHLHPTILALHQHNVPVIYMHHDWIYKVKALRFNKPIDIKQKEIECRIVRKVNGFVSGSYSEFKEAMAIGNNNSYYIPISYPEVPEVSDKDFAQIPDIVHLGGMGATANRIGLKNFIEKAWPAMSLMPERLLIIGNLEGAGEDLKTELKKYKTTGFVKDLAPLLRYGDIHIIPWHENTGQRTRLPLILSYGQVVVAVDQSVKGFPELINGENCILVQTVEEMAPAILNVIYDKLLRKRLAQNAIKTFKNCFATSKLIGRYQDAIYNIVELKN